MGDGLRERLRGRLDARTVFVVGKGGVGKTTTAAAVGLDRARSVGPTHLISTDPAHSLADVLGLDDGVEGVRDGVCGVPLTVEEFDARSYADAWIRKASGPVTELFELGTYLDGEDIGTFLDLSLPGLDEVMAALRLDELADGGDRRIVVDTAPTGHALRLLDAGDVLGSWIRALRAMARKATVVAERLSRRDVRLGAETFVDELETRVERFRDRVLGEACFLVVERSGELVARETERLERSLGERGLRTCARIRVGEGPGGEAGPWTVPHRTDLRGCEGLARWGEPGAAETAAGRATGPRVEEGRTPPDPIRELLGRRVVLVAGKGGVGKSTCAAAVAAWTSECVPTVLVSTDPAGSLEALFDVELEADEGRSVTGGLVLRQLDAEVAFGRFVERYRDQVERIARGLGVDRGAELDRAVIASLLGLAPPGIDEIIALAMILDAVEEGRLVIVDSAPTGHFLRLLSMPERALEWTRALMRILLKYRSVAGLNESAERLLELTRRLKSLRELLTDPERCATLLVTLDEPVVAAESGDLFAAVRRANLPVGAWILNRSPGRSERVPVPDDGPVGPRPPGLAAPEMAEPPRGVDELRAFLFRWTVAEHGS